MSLFESKQENDVCRILLSENFTAPVVPSLQQHLKQRVAEGSRTVIFDMSATRMLDSSGIGLLTATANSLSATGGCIKVVAVTPEIFRLLKMMRLVERLNVSEQTGSRD